MPPKKQQQHVGFHKRFKLPTRDEQLKGVLDKGEKVDAIPPELYPFESQFHDVPEPTDEDDWLHQFNESKDTFQVWKRLYYDSDWRAGRTPETGVVYLRALGHFEESAHFSVQAIAEFVQIFWPKRDIRVLPPLQLVEQDGQLSIPIEKNTRRGVQAGGMQVKTRVAHPYDIEKAPPGSRQIAVDGPLRALHDSKPEDAFCVIGVTMEDLFEGRDDSFVMGMAAGGSGVAVFSFARYSPAFRRKNQKLPKKDQQTLFARSCKVVVHELGHLYAIDHCTFFFCCMNGSGHLLEDYAQPLHFCPVDLRKLQKITGCDLNERYRALFEYYKTHGFTEDAKWVEKLISLMNSRRLEHPGNPLLANAPLQIKKQSGRKRPADNE